MAAEPPLIVIVGPTASGKTGLAIELAKKLNGEIICADSRTVYRDMNIGTAKPTIAEMNSVSHYMLDLVNPNERFTLWNFQQLAKQKIAEIRARGKTPFLVGGSGLYVDSIIFDYKLKEKTDDSQRQKLDRMSVDDLLTMIKLQHIELPSNYQNKRHLVRAIEQGGVNRKRRSEPINTFVVGITTKKEILEQRICHRSKKMLDGGLVDEVKYLIDNYGPDCEPFNNNLYGEVKKFINGEIKTEAELIGRMTTVDRQLAKKQLTWFRSNNYIEWLSLEEAVPYVTNIFGK